MRQTIRKLFWIWEFDKEEKWLNEMSLKGLQLSAVGLCKYVFDEGIPGEYSVRLELLENLPTQAESVQYIKFIEDTGAEYIGSITRWVYFRKKSTEGGFNLFSDIDSRIKHLKRILTLASVSCISAFLVSISNLSIYLNNGAAPNIFFSILFTLLGILIGCGFRQIYRKMSKLKKERELHE